MLSTTDYKTVDVVVCTYNSERYLSQCLQSIKQNIPVKNLWIIDNYSEDRTVDIALQFKAIITQSHCSLAEARKLSFQLVETPLFVNVDSDVVLSPTWFTTLMKYWTKDTGCVWGITVDQDSIHKLYLQSMWKFRRAESYNIPHLPNMIAKKMVVEDIKFPPRILDGSVANEDWFVKFWIEQKGFRCVTVPFFSNHYSYPSQASKSTWYGASSRVSGLETLQNLTMRFILSFFQGAYAALASKNVKVFSYWIKFRFNSLYGFLHYKKYYDLKRKK